MEFRVFHGTSVSSATSFKVTCEFVNDFNPSHELCGVGQRQGVVWLYI